MKRLRDCVQPPRNIGRCQADCLARMTQLCLPETFTRLSLVGRRRKQRKCPSPNCVGGRGQGIASVLCNSLKIILMCSESEHPRAAGPEGTLLFQFSACPRSNRDTKAGDWKQPARDRSLFPRTAKTLTPVSQPWRPIPWVSLEEARPPIAHSSAIAIGNFHLPELRFPHMDE